LMAGSDSSRNRPGLLTIVPMSDSFILLRWILHHQMLLGN
jgi:hypothetical protein